jgi:hypothetical protein
VLLKVAWEQNLVALEYLVWRGADVTAKNHLGTDPAGAGFAVEFLENQAHGARLLGLTTSSV